MPAFFRPLLSSQLSSPLNSLLSSLLILAILQDASAQTAPSAARHDSRLSLHGETLSDDYHWLQNKKNPAVLAYIKAENAYADAASASFTALTAKLAGEIADR